MKVQTSLYPTYKSVKPISHATKNFLEWLRTQPAGPVILLGHSMGGLLAAEAATDPSNTKDGSKRIVGMIAFDCPYLGMHPHVVYSGIASLFPKKGDPGGETEAELNPSDDVRIVDRKVTDDWDAYKKQHQVAGASTPSLHPTHSSSSSISQRSLPSSSSTSNSLIGRTMNFISSHSDDPLVRWARKHSDEPFSSGKRWVLDHFQFGICMFDPSGLKDRYTTLVAWNGLWVNYWSITVPKPDSPAIERLSGNQASRSAENENHEQELVDDNDVALVESGVAELGVNSSGSGSGSGGSDYGSALETQDHRDSLDSPEPPALGPKTKSQAKSDGKSAEKERKAQEKEKRKAEKAHEKEQKRLKKELEAEAKAVAKAEKEKNKVKVGRHFIVLPTGLGAILGGRDNWEKVVIGGVDDEVAAHCGLFISGQNLDYDGLVQRVGTRVIEWCKKV